MPRRSFASVFALIVATAALLAAACGEFPEDDNRVVVVPDAGSGQDARIIQFPDTSSPPADTPPEQEPELGVGDDSTSCGGDWRACRGECVDLRTSDRHCGRCGNACPGGSACHQGVCECSGSRELCGGSCINTDISDRHCGRCGNACSSGTTCRSGACKCPSGQSLCGGECIETSADEDNCGGCGKTCGAGEVCENSSCKTDSRVQGVISETNKARSTKTDCGDEGVKPAANPLSGHPKLHQAAQAHADDMVMNNFFDHTGSDGSDFAERIRRTGFSGRPVGENIAAGNSSATATVQQWVDSDGHCKNLMKQRATLIGVGVARGARYGWYWVQVFATK